MGAHLQPLFAASDDQPGSLKTIRAAGFGENAENTAICAAAAIPKNLS
jgi:hypothetical protein